MPTLYLTEQGSYLRKTSKRLVVEKDGKLLLEVPEFKVDHVLIFGNIGITTPAINFLLEAGIPTSFLSTHNRLRGKLVPIESKNVYLRITQVERLKDEEFKLSLAKDIVLGKIRNQRTLLMKYSRNHPEIDFKPYINELKELMETLANKTKVSTVLGVEGYASACYFEGFAKCFRKELKFEKRIKRPPSDPINSLLSLGYSTLTNEVSSTLSAIGLDPYIGYLHALEYGRPSLALDLVEEFRQPIVNTLTLMLINKEILKINDFDQNNTAGVYLKEPGKKIYFYHYEKKLQTKLHVPDLSDEITYRRLLYHQAQKLWKSINEKVSYKSYQIE